MSTRSEIIKERLDFFVKDKKCCGNDEAINFEIPYRVLRGYKLDAVVEVLRDLLREKFGKDFKCTKCEDNKIDSYIFELLPTVSSSS